MFLSTNKIRKWELEFEPHNMYVDSSESCLFDDENISSSEVHIGIPYPIGNTSDLFCTRDPLEQLNEEKTLHIEKLKCARRIFSLKDIKEYKAEGSIYTKLPKALLSAYRYKDPDPDWENKSSLFFNGGVLDHITLDDREYLIFCVISENTLHLFDLDSSQACLLPIKPDTPVLYIKVYQEKLPILLIREKYKVSLHNIEGQNVNDKYSVDSEEAIIDAKLNTKQIQHFGVLKKSGLSVTNLPTNKVICSFKNTDKKNLIQFEFISKQKILLLDDFLVQIINYKKNTVLDTFDPKLLQCNPLKAIRIMDDTAFLVSQHYIVKMNFKNLDDVSTFAHSMEAAPVLIDIARDTSNAYLCLANPFLEEKILFGGRSLYSLPYKVPSVLNGLKEACLFYPDLLLINDLEETINVSVTGLKLVKHENVMNIFFVNAVGCVFRQEISESQCDTKQPCDMFNKWATKMRQRDDQPPIHITNFADMSEMFFFLSRPVDASKKPTNETNNEEFNRFFNKLGCVYSKGNIKGTIAKEFLSIWEDSDDESDDEQEDHATEEQFRGKVNDWMDTFENSFNDVEEINLSQFNL